MKVRIKNVIGSTGNEWLLWELKKEAGVKEGDIVKEGDTLVLGYLEGKYTGIINKEDRVVA